MEKKPKFCYGTRHSLYPPKTIYNVAKPNVYSYICHDPMIINNVYFGIVLDFLI